MAIDASRALGPLGVMVMLGRVKYWCQMASSADSISVSQETSAMRFVTVRARYTGMKHPTLEERAMHVDLIQDLPVSVV